jgi:hypothetical protein
MLFVAIPLTLAQTSSFHDCDNQGFLQRQLRNTSGLNELENEKWVSLDRRWQEEELLSIGVNECLFHLSFFQQ